MARLLLLSQACSACLLPTWASFHPLQACPLFGELLQKALALLLDCGCDGPAGCPSCCQHTDCGEYNATLHKAAAVVVLKAVLEAEGCPAPGQGPDGEDQVGAAAAECEPAGAL